MRKLIFILSFFTLLLLQSCFFRVHGYRDGEGHQEHHGEEHHDNGRHGGDEHH